MNLTPGEAQRTAERLTSAARSHKHAIKVHRLALREEMRELAELRAFCERAGIRLTTTGEGGTHGQGEA